MNAGDRAADSASTGTPGRVGGTPHLVAVWGRGLGATVESWGWLPQRERGWRLLLAGRHSFVGGPAHRAAYPENGKGFEVELVAGEDEPGAATGAGVAA